MSITQKNNVLYLAVIAVIATSTLFASPFGDGNESVAVGECIGYMATGKDCYRNGKPLAAGECYALIWEKEQGKFWGFLRNGNLVNPNENENAVAAFIPAEEFQKNPNVTFQITELFTKSHPKGQYNVVVLDTRDINGVPVGVSSADNRLHLVNGWGWAQVRRAVRMNVKPLLGAGDDVAGYVTENKTELPEGFKTPRISAIAEGENGHMMVNVAETEDYLAYELRFGTQLDKIDTALGNPVQGNGANEDMVVRTEQEMTGVGFAQVKVVDDIPEYLENLDHLGK